MAFKMKGAPMHDTSSKHGTNANYKKSGAPGLLGKIMDPLGLFKKGKQMLGKGNCPPAGQPQPAAAAPAPDAPAQPAAPAPAAAAAPDPAAAAPMKESLKKGAPMKASSAKDKESGIATVKAYAKGEKHVGTKRTPKELLALAKKAEKAGSSDAAKKMRDKAARAKMEKRRAGEYLESKKK
jgi:hypothetical protein